MKRRDLALTLALAPTPLLSALMAGSAHAAGEPAEGKDYQRVQPAVAVAVPGKIEVLEFFGYWCPHCAHLEPKLEAWVKKLPADVNFRRIAVGWQPAHDPFRKLFFALEALGMGPTHEIHGKVFKAVHVQRLRLENDEVLSAFAKDNGIDAAKLLDAMKGFSVAAKLRMSTQMFAAYKADGVPALALNGRFLTGPSMAGGEDEALRVLDTLMAQVRAGR